MIKSYLVNNLRQVGRFVDEEIGVEYELDYECTVAEIGVITVYDLEHKEHQKIRKFISDKKLWSE